MADGKIEAFQSKKDEMMYAGEGKKKKKNKKKEAQPSEKDGLQIDLAVINKFGIADVSPPQAPDQLDQKIEDLEAKKKVFRDRGEKELADAKDELIKNVERDARAELDKEQKERDAAERDPYGDEYDGEEDKVAEDDQDGEELDAPRDRGGGQQRERGDGGYFGNKYADDEGTSDKFAGAYSKPSRGATKVGARGGG